MRRTAELAAIIVSWIVFRALQKDGENDPALKRRLERAVKSGVGAALCLSGLAMLFIAFFSAHSDQQNVIPGLIIAFLGVIVNSWFWFRYGKLYREKPDAILAVQSRLYRAKTVVDVCVVLALLFVVLAPKAAITSIVDVGGSVVVALYLVRSGILTTATSCPPPSRWFFCPSKGVEAPFGSPLTHQRRSLRHRDCILHPQWREPPLLRLVE